MSREHVVSAGPDTADGHPSPAPDFVGLPDPPAPHGEVVRGGVGPRLALQMRPRHREGGDQHREAPEKEHGAG